jgi:hypothetical protein
MKATALILCNAHNISGLLLMSNPLIFMKRLTYIFPLSLLLVSCNYTSVADSSAELLWWQISLLGLGILCLIWFTRNKPGWTFEGPIGCPAEIAKALGILFALALLGFGIIGAFNPRALGRLENGINVLNDAVSAWEIIIGVIIFCVFSYFLVLKPGYRILFRRNELGESEGCSFLFWAIFLSGYIYWLIHSGHWKEIFDPFIHLYQLWFG